MRKEACNYFPSLTITNIYKSHFHNNFNTFNPEHFFEVSMIEIHKMISCAFI